ncbi:MAG: hypothetical protein EHM61_24580 [Acidobacteria bacterium]|nr:MAG: hypothetical protein EHM61_24580 [Acidobacteriota bacterium]
MHVKRLVHCLLLIFLFFGGVSPALAGQDTDKYNRKLNEIEVKRFKDRQKLEAEYLKLFQKKESPDLKKLQKKLDEFRRKLENVDKKYYRRLQKIERERAKEG